MTDGPVDSVDKLFIHRFGIGTSSDLKAIDENIYNIINVLQSDLSIQIHISASRKHIHSPRSVSIHSGQGAAIFR